MIPPFHSITLLLLLLTLSLCDSGMAAMNCSHAQWKSFSSPLNFMGPWASRNWSITDHLHPLKQLPRSESSSAWLRFRCTSLNWFWFKGDGVVSIDFRLRTWLIPCRCYACYAVGNECDRSWDSFPFHLRLWQPKVTDNEGMRLLPWPH